MKPYSARLWVDQTTEPGRPHHISNVLRLFTEHLARRRDAQVLDVGPVCGENITFFAQRVKRLFVCDMFLRLDLARRKGLPQSHAWQHLDYPSQSFDGIMLWGLIDYLDDREVRSLVDLCHAMLRPSGTLLAVVRDEHAFPSVINSYVIAEDFGVYPRPQTHLALPSQRRNNRSLLAMVDPFIPLKSFIYRDGIREMLLQYN